MWGRGAPRTFKDANRSSLQPGVLSTNGYSSLVALESSEEVRSKYPVVNSPFVGIGIH